MKLLVDTHVLVWAALDPGRLSQRATERLRDRDNQLLLSVVSAYEIEQKRSLDEILSRLPDLGVVTTGLDMEWLAVNAAHAKLAGGLPRHHGDPFDRLIVAQSILENAPVLTRDSLISRYGVPVIW